MNLQISFLVGVFIVILYSLVENIIFGNRGKKNQINEHFKLLKGSDNKRTVKKKKNLKSDNMDITGEKKLLIILISGVVIFLFTYVIFKMFIISFMLSTIGYLVPKAISKHLLEKKNDMINNQFREALRSLVSSLKAGYSINSAIKRCCDELNKFYKNEKNKLIVNEFEKINDDLNTGLPIDKALLNFNKRMNNEDIEDFVYSIIIVREKGGNLVQVMENVSTIITDKLTIKRDIKRMTAAKRVESMILSLLPIFMIVALSLISPGYFDSLRDSLIGNCLVIVGFFLLAVNYFVGKKVIDIKV